MSVYLRGKTWTCRFQYAGERRSMVCEGATNRKEAEAFEAEQKKLVEGLKTMRSDKAIVENYKVELTGGRRVLLNDGFKLASSKPTSRTASEKWDAVKASCWADFLAFMGSRHKGVLYLDQVTASHAEEYVARLQTKGRFRKVISQGKGKAAYTNRCTSLSARTVNCSIVVLKQVFSLLAEDASITINPFANIKKMRALGETREPFTAEEIGKILEQADDFTRPLFIIALTTGLREGDICTLRWDNLDFEKGIITRRQNKTQATVTIPMMPQLRSYLEGLPHTDDVYVLPEQNRIYTAGTGGVTQRVKKLLDACGIVSTRAVKGRTQRQSVKDLHSCRHTFCWLAGQAGIPLPTVQSIVGHLSPQMTELYASHVTTSQKQAGIARLSGNAMYRLLDGMASPIEENTSDVAAQNFTQLKARRLIERLSEDQLKEILDKYNS